jgi:hypothetical protein
MTTPHKAGIYFIAFKGMEPYKEVYGYPKCHVRKIREWPGNTRNFNLKNGRKN